MAFADTRPRIFNWFDDISLSDVDAMQLIAALHYFFCQNRAASTVPPPLVLPLRRLQQQAYKGIGTLEMSKTYATRQE